MNPGNRKSWQALVPSLIGAVLLSGCHHGSNSSATPTYTISVSVTGLAGSGLVLQNNGTDNLSVTASGTATFSTRAAVNATFSVTVLTQPTSPAQVCSVFYGLGYVAGGNVVVPVSCGTTGAATGRFAYVANSGAGTISAYAIDPTSGAMTPVSGSPITVPGSTALYQAQIDPSDSYLYVVDVAADKLFGFLINQSTGLLTPVSGSPYATGKTPVSLAFDGTGTYVYVANYGDSTISAYALTVASGALTALSGSPYAIPGTSPAPRQIARSGDYLFSANFNANSVQVFAIAAGTGELTSGIGGSSFATDAQPHSLAINPAGTVLYTANNGAGGTGSISAFTLDLSTGKLTPVTGSPYAIPVVNNITVDSQNHYLMVTESAGIAVYPIVNPATGVLNLPIAGSPFATGTNPYSVSVDLTDQFVYVGNDGSANISEFTLNGATGVLTAVAGSPMAAGANPDYVVIQ
ncbi:MAG: beta-propeller fold lactonase family protein [Steroidobacterales bacterium]